MRQRGPWWLTSATLYVAHIVQKLYKHFFLREGRRGRDRMVVEFTATCAISIYHH